MLTFLTGFAASIAHVATGPDHLAAVTPLAIDSRKKSWFIGLSWGFGHTVGMLLIGLLFVLFKEFIPVDAIAAYSDRAVGILLICIGTWAGIRIFLKHRHGNLPHGHFHTKPYLYTHIHKHTHSPGPVFNINHTHDHDHPHTHVHYPAKNVSITKNALTAFSIGILHGFAGFSHLFALLPSLALPTVTASVVYIAAFASGTILTMVVFAGILGIVAHKSASKEKQTFLKWFSVSGAVLAVFIGILWIIHPV
jgi:ABC-type nickel/cobalt efflux system permease component RcnA